MAARNPSRADQRLLEPFWREPVHRSVLPNGLTLLLKPDQSAPIASVQVWVKTGSIHEGDHLGAGLSHYLEHLLFKGTTRRAGREISAAVQACGGGINAYTTFDRTVYYIDLPAESADFALELLADMVLNSTLPPEEVSREKDVILREIAMGQDDPDQRLGESLFQAAFREHPFRHPIIGYREVFAETTRDDLLAYYHTRYVPNNLVVVVTGAIDPTALSATVARHFGAAPRRRMPPVLVPEEPRQLAPRAHHRFEDVEISRAGLAWQIPGLTHPDAPVLDVLATVLGGGDSSLLWQEIRDQAGLVHAIDATSWSPGSVGLFYVSYTSEPAKREEATTAILDALQRWSRRGLTSAQVRKAVRQLVVGEINSRKTMSGQASRLGVAEVVAGDLAFGRNYFQRLFAVTPADLMRVIKVHLTPDNLTSVSINPAAAAKTESTGSAISAGALTDFEEFLLPNGARLLLQPQRNLPNIHLRLTCLGGPAYEASDKRGATALLATLLTKDTKRRTAAQVANFIEEVGGAFAPFSGNNSFGLSVEVLSTEAGRALQVLADAMLQPAFRPATFRLEREAQLAAVRQDQDDVVTFGQKLLRQKFFGVHPLAIESIGSEAGLTALTPADLKDLHRRLGVASNVVLSVAGDFDRKVILPQLKAFLRRLPRGDVAPPAGKFAGPVACDYVEKQPRQQAVVFVAYPAPVLKSADFYVAEVADELFSGMSSRLFERVREEKGLAYFVRSARVIGLDAAMFYFMAGTAPGSEAAVQAEIEAEIARVAAGEVTPAELQRCQTRLKAGRRMSLQTNASRAAQAGLNAVYGLPVNDWKNYGAHIDAVQIDDLTRFARTYLHRDGRLRLVVRP
jgi:zinc protease